LAQLRTPGLQKGKLLNPFLTLPVGLLLPPLSVGHCIGQAPGVLLGHILSLVCLRKLALEKVNPLSETSTGVVVLFASNLNNLSQASLSARAAWSSTSLTRAAMLSHAATASWEEAYIVHNIIAREASAATVASPHLNHLLLRCGCTSNASGQMLGKQRQRGIREPEGSYRYSGKQSFSFKLT
jgi:hypothetical protein